MGYAVSPFPISQKKLCVVTSENKDAILLAVLLFQSKLLKSNNDQQQKQQCSVITRAKVNCRQEEKNEYQTVRNMQPLLKALSLCLSLRDSLEKGIFIIYARST